MMHQSSSANDAAHAEKNARRLHSRAADRYDCAVAESFQTVVVNGEPLETPVHCTVEALLALLGRQPGNNPGRRVAVAINRCVVPRSTYPSVNIQAGDRIEILEAVGGG